MGNTGSKDSPDDASSNQPSSTTSQRFPNESPISTSNPSKATPKRPPRRRESIQTISAIRPAALSPVAATEIIKDQPTTQSRASTAQGRGRSHTVATTSSQNPNQVPADMGNTASSDSPRSIAIPQRDKDRSRSPLRPFAAPVPTVAPSDAHSYHATMSPIAVPSALPPPAAQFGRPPRLPIPIEQEYLAPGSPIISPTDVSGSVIDAQELESPLPRKSSVLSNTTIDDDEIGDDAMRASGAEAGRPTVPTLIEWKEGGEAVYVTGTFANYWDKKIRLRPGGPSPDKDPKVLSSIIPLYVGTHHLAFIVDNQMRTASHMPTTVDWTNALVNYVEVNADDLPKQVSKEVKLKEALHPVQPQPLQPEERATREVQQPQAPTQHLHDNSQTASHAPTAIPTRMSSTKRPTKTPSIIAANAAAAASAGKKAPTIKHYDTEIPRFLLDLDAQEESTRYHRATAVMGTQPAPPSLPMFLNKSILNGITPIKDDSSVLIMPNHTVLNHLATSSIKNGVLATSATTRYRKKYVTTIMYKPTSEARE